MESRRSRMYSRVQDIPAAGPEEVAAGVATSQVYKFRVTEHLLRLMESSRDGGLRKQFMPSDRELTFLEGEYPDVADEPTYNPVPGVIHRYPSKVLLFLTLNCASYCRFCFRRERINDKLQPAFSAVASLSRAFDYIRRERVREVILSGGDPFFCSDALLAEVVERLLAEDAVKLVRYHTRFLTFDPDRISDELVQIVRPKATSFVVAHVNQRVEITPGFARAAARLIDAGIPVFTQTALLRGVNDQVDALKELFESLIALRIKPYYLFHSDPGRGLDHFRVTLHNGIGIYRSLYNQISGLAMPIYLMNVPAGHGHVIIDLGNVKQVEKGRYLVKGWDGQDVLFTDPVD